MGAPCYDLDVQSVDGNNHVQGENTEIDEENAGDMGRLFDIEQIRALPYSGYEAKLVAKQLNCFPLTGEKATKYQIKRGNRVLHIATHGMVKEIGERNIWYNSGLTFSGVINWYIRGEERDGYGNGLLTAEEISRMDLGTTELAVLSACNSGTSTFTLYEQQSGLHLAFGTAGVKYVISALWRVDDLATAILMKYFYQFLLSTQDVPGSLLRAKNALKHTSVRELRMLINHDKDLLTEKFHDKIEVYLQDIPQDTFLYSSPRYSAAFVCYQYKF
jgi:CHAT domain-containing protein